MECRKLLIGKYFKFQNEVHSFKPTQTAWHISASCLYRSLCFLFMLLAICKVFSWTEFLPLTKFLPFVAAVFTWKHYFYSNPIGFVGKGLTCQARKLSLAHGAASQTLLCKDVGINVLEKSRQMKVYYWAFNQKISRSVSKRKE